MGSGVCKIQYKSRANAYSGGNQSFSYFKQESIIDNFNECEKWTQTEGIMHVKIKYKTAQEWYLSVFTIEGTQRTIFPKRSQENYNALERVAVLSAEIADGVRDNCADWKEVPYIFFTFVHQGGHNSN